MVTRSAGTCSAPQNGVWHTVVGIAGDVVNNGPDHHPDLEYYELRKHFEDDTYNNRQPGVGWRAANVIVRNFFVSGSDGQDCCGR